MGAPASRTAGAVRGARRGRVGGRRSHRSHAQAERALRACAMARDEPASDRRRSVSRRPLLTFEHEDPRAQVLVVTSGWPNEDNQTYCIFIKRQMESLIERGLRCDVLFIRGYRSQLAYGRAGLRLAWWSLARRRSYELVHVHSGEAALSAGFYRRCPLLVSYLGDDLLGTPDAAGAIS